MLRIVTITLTLETDADDRALERALESLIDERSVRDQLLEGEALELRGSSAA